MVAVEASQHNGLQAETPEGSMLQHHGCLMSEIPTVVSGFVAIYVPGEDSFPGPDSENVKSGELCKRWIANDHTLVKGGDGRWHAFGIVGPESRMLHEGTWMAFHAIGPSLPLREVIASRLWEEHPKVLPPAERLNERRELWAPFVVEREGIYYMFYGPCEIRLAISTDLFLWEPRGTCFAQQGGARDPWVTEIGGVPHMVYTAGESVWLRTSANLFAWSDPREIFRMRRPGAPESPVLIERKGWFYLFWTLYDGENGPYDNRTFVYTSRSPHDFNTAEEVAMLPAHAPELIQDEEGRWFITSAEWPRRGVSIAPLEWR